MTTAEASTTSPSPQARVEGLPPAAHVGQVDLVVRSLDASLEFYVGALGLVQLERAGALARLGSRPDGETLVVLHEQPDAHHAGRHAGLYHLALLAPTRDELATMLLRLSARGVGISGASDHGISEAIYLDDPDGIGVELVVDRPRASWPDLASGDLEQWRPRALDIDSLLSAAASLEPAPRVGPGWRIGHIHLHVADLEAATAFYREVIGFEVMTSLPGATFVAAGGYHHHVGYNTWRGVGIPLVPDGVVGMRHATLRVGDAVAHEALVERVRASGLEVESATDGVLIADPSGNRLIVRV